MSRTKTRLFLTGVSAIAVAATLAVDEGADPAGLSFVSAAYASGEGEGEGEGSLGQLGSDEAIMFASGLRHIEAELNAGWAATVAGDSAGATKHFEHVLAYMMGAEGKALEEEGLDVDHMGDEIKGLIMMSKDGGSPEDIRDVYEHGLFEVDEHLLAIDPLVRRDARFAKAVILAELAEASSNFRKGVRGDRASARRAIAFAGLARTEFGRVAVGFNAIDGARTAKAIKALDQVVALAGGKDKQAFLSAVSRIELALYGF